MESVVLALELALERLPMVKSARQDQLAADVALHYGLIGSRLMVEEKLHYSEGWRHQDTLASKTLRAVLKAL